MTCPLIEFAESRTAVRKPADYNSTSRTANLFLVVDPRIQRLHSMARPPDRWYTTQ
jgi:hypothetical protein